MFSSYNLCDFVEAFASSHFNKTVGFVSGGLLTVSRMMEIIKYVFRTSQKRSRFFCAFARRGTIDEQYILVFRIYRVNAGMDIFLAVFFFVWKRSVLYSIAKRALPLTIDITMSSWTRMILSSVFFIKTCLRF